MHPSISPLRLISTLLVSGFVLPLVSLPLPVKAQIASPVNAGQNSGDNAFGSSRTNIGTPNFSQGLITLLVRGLRREADGSIIASADIQVSVQNALSTLVAADEPASNLLIQLLNTSGDNIPVNPEIQDLTATLINQLASSGLDRSSATHLIMSLVGLANQTTLNQLGSAINRYNQIVKNSSPELRSALSQNSVFRAIGTTLRSGRNALASRITIDN